MKMKIFIFVDVNWRRTLYRVVDKVSFDETDSPLREIRNVEMRIFRNIKDEISRKSKGGEWQGTKEQNESADKQIRY